MFAECITAEMIEELPYCTFPGQATVIEDSRGEAYEAAIKYLSSRKLIGFDTESKPSFTHEHRSNGVALLQLSGENKAFLFRTKMTGIPSSLARILSDPDIIKVGAAVADDVRGLQRIAGFSAGGFVDLQKIVGKFGINDRSVKKMAGIILGVRISKAQQLSNWEAQALSPAQIAYAATDAWICRQMYKRLLDEPGNILEEGA